jgi:uncharacterized protein YbaP (TraB family)
MVGMKRRLVVILALFVACRDSSRATQPAPVAQPGNVDPWTQPAPAKDPLKRPLLWSLEKDGRTSYLLGTMHGGVDPTTRLPDLVWQKLDGSPAFAMETDLSKAQIDFRRHDGKTLRDELGAEYWQKLEAALGAGVADRLLNMTPMIPATTLSMRDLPETPPMDGVLHGHAQNAHKRLIYLEDASLQLAVLARWMNARALQDILDDLPGVKQRSLAMLASYVAGDEAGIQAVMQAERERWLAKGRPAAEYDEQMEDVLYRRNASWIDAIEKAHGEGGVFIAVGALHALGPRSVLDLLAKRGFTVTRLVP